VHHPTARLGVVYRSTEPLLGAFARAAPNLRHYVLDSSIGKSARVESQSEKTSCVDHLKHIWCACAVFETNFETGDQAVILSSVGLKKWQYHFGIGIRG
jgi:hypothetical protein